MIYQVTVYVEIAADSERDAYEHIVHALNHAKKAEIIYLDAEVTASRDEAIEDWVGPDSNPIGADEREGN